MTAAPNRPAPITAPAFETRPTWALRLALAVALAGAAGLVAAWLTPRGPVTTLEALAAMAMAVAVGLAAGFVMGSRWSALVAPLAFLVVFELGRLGTPGPTVDQFNLGSVYGILAFVVGRGFHGLLALAPMIPGALLGVEVAARLRRGPTTARPLGLRGWLAAVAVALALIVLAVLIARPATTAPIVGTDGQPLPGSVAELTTVRLGGADQTVMIRGRGTDLPVLIHLAGGPGGTDLGAMRADTGLEQHFVVATWDQRGTGKSYAAIEPFDTLTVEAMVADLLELTEYLRERFDEDRIYLSSNSWGSILGVLAVQQRPDLFHALVGTGQMVSPAETDRMFWEDALAWAEQTGQDGLAATLRANGPPPYDDLLAYESAVGTEHGWNPYPDLDPGKEMPWNLFVPENTVMDRVNGMRGFLDSFATLYPQLQTLDLRRDAASLEVPVYVVLGRYEARGRAVPATEWFELLRAPAKELVIFERSGHRPSFEEPAEFAALMARIAAEAAGR